MDDLFDIPMAFFVVAVLGGLVFALGFNIPARRKLLSRQTEERGRAMKYDALNFLTFFITFIVPMGFMRHQASGQWDALVFLTTLFIVYSVGFWVPLRIYIWKHTYECK